MAWVAFRKPKATKTYKNPRRVPPKGCRKAAKSPENGQAESLAGREQKAWLPAQSKETPPGLGRRRSPGEKSRRRPSARPDKGGDTSADPQLTRSFAYSKSVKTPKWVAVFWWRAILPWYL